MNRTVVVFVLVLLVLSSGFLESTAAASEKDMCDSKCKVRCSKVGLKLRCTRKCKSCCEKCKCVPPGTAASKDSCPCYKDMKDSRGKPKCP